MSAGYGLSSGTALVAAGTSGPPGAWVRRLRDAGLTVLLTGGDRESSETAVEHALEVGGRLDVLVTAPGTPYQGSIEETPEAAFRELLELNLTSAFRIGRACFHAMRAQGGGSMIYVASDVGIRAAHETGAYSVASAGLIALAELFAAEGAPHGIRANAVCPTSAADAASVIAFLASDESAHVNGATLRVDDAAGAAMVLDTRV